MEAALTRFRQAGDRWGEAATLPMREGQAALGEEEFATAYANGWKQDTKTATTTADPARLPR